MKPVILAAAVLALSTQAALPALAANTPKQTVADTSAVPDAVKAYVKRNAGDSILHSGAIRVGQSLRELDAGEVWRQVPDYPQYSWANLSGQLVVIDNQAKKVVAVY
jgi:hypothetical protein